MWVDPSQERQWLQTMMVSGTGRGCCGRGGKADYSCVETTDVGRPLIDMWREAAAAAVADRQLLRRPLQ